MPGSPNFQPKFVFNRAPLRKAQDLHLEKSENKAHNLRGNYNKKLVLHNEIDPLTDV